MFQKHAAWHNFAVFLPNIAGSVFYILLDGIKKGYYNPLCNDYNIVFITETVWQPR